MASNNSDNNNNNNSNSKKQGLIDIGLQLAKKKTIGPVDAVDSTPVGNINSDNNNNNNNNNSNSKKHGLMGIGIQLAKKKKIGPVDASDSTPVRNKRENEDAMKTIVGKDAPGFFNGTAHHGAAGLAGAALDPPGSVADAPSGAGIVSTGNLKTTGLEGRWKDPVGRVAGLAPPHISTDSFAAAEVLAPAAAGAPGKKADAPAKKSNNPEDAQDQLTAASNDPPGASPHISTDSFAAADVLAPAAAGAPGKKADASAKKSNNPEAAASYDPPGVLAAAQAGVFPAPLDDAGLNSGREEDPIVIDDDNPAGPGAAAADVAANAIANAIAAGALDDEALAPAALAISAANVAAIANALDEFDAAEVAAHAAAPAFQAGGVGGGGGDGGDGNPIVLQEERPVDSIDRLVQALNAMAPPRNMREVYHFISQLPINNPGHLFWRQKLGDERLASEGCALFRLLHQFGTLATNPPELVRQAPYNTGRDCIPWNAVFDAHLKQAFSIAAMKFGYGLTFQHTRYKTIPAMEHEDQVTAIYAAAANHYPPRPGVAKMVLFFACVNVHPHDVGDDQNPQSSLWTLLRENDWHQHLSTMKGKMRVRIWSDMYRDERGQPIEKKLLNGAIYIWHAWILDCFFNCGEALNYDHLGHYILPAEYDTVVARNTDRIWN